MIATFSTAMFRSQWDDISLDGQVDGHAEYECDDNFAQKQLWIFGDGMSAWNAI